MFNTNVLSLLLLRDNIVDNSTIDGILMFVSAV